MLGHSRVPYWDTIKFYIGTLSSSIFGHADVVRCASVSVSSWVRPKQSSDLVITGSQDGILHIWDNDINQLSGPVKSFPGMADAVIENITNHLCSIALP